MRALMTVATLFATQGAAAETVRDHVYANVAFTFPPATLTCIKGHTGCDYPVAGQILLAWPAINDYAELSHYASLESELSFQEDCSARTAILSAADRNGGKLTADVRGLE